MTCLTSSKYVACRIPRARGGCDLPVAALVDPAAVGFALTAFIWVTLETPSHRRAFLARLAGLAEVQECHHVTGDDDYLLKVRCRGPLDLDRLLTEQLKAGPGVVRTRTQVVLRCEKESVGLPPLLDQG